MASIFDLKPRPADIPDDKADEKPIVSVGPEQSGPVTSSAPPLPSAGMSAAKNGRYQSPEPPPATESVKSAGPAAWREPVKQSAQQASSATPKSSPPKPRAENVPVSEPVNIPEPASGGPDPSPVREDEGEFELVLGRRQIASWLFVGTVLIAVFSAAAYFVGKTSAPNCVGALADQTVPYVAPPLPAATIVPAGEDPILDASGAPVSSSGNSSPAIQTPAATQPPVVSAGSTLAATSVGPASVAGSAGAPGPSAPAGPAASGPVVRPLTPAATIEPPIFAQPQPGALYLQMGAVDKGVAVVLAEGLRRQGFTSLVAPGPTDKIFRVLIGPLENQDAYRRVKAQVNAIDLSTFARRFQK